MIISGIGSRETPTHIQEQMFQIGVWCLENQVWVRSGHADGADWAFEQGAQEYCLAYLPWLGFNKHLTSRARWCIPQVTSAMLDITKKYHPAYEKLSPGGLQLMARNACQILGVSLKDPVNAVVCWTKDGEPSGGTGQAIRIAMDRGIPILNMYHQQFYDHLKVQNELLRISEQRSKTSS